jgi:hypothetical protein
MIEQKPARQGVEDGLGLELTRPPAPTPVDGQLAWESTVTAPTDWVPYVYTESELRTRASRRGLSVASLALGSLGLLASLFTLWAAPLSLVAVIIAAAAMRSERLAGRLWLYGLATGLAGLILAAVWLAYVL